MGVGGGHESAASSYGVAGHRLEGDSVARRMTIHTRTRVLLFAALSLTLTTSARAEGQDEQRFGAPGFIISADRLLSLLTYQSIKTSSDGSSGTESRLSIALLNNQPPYVFGSFYNLPRIGFDWLPIQNLTLGGAAWVYTDLQVTDSEAQPGVPSKSADQPNATYWGVAPRVGYVVRLADKLSVWPRAGVEYHHVSLSGAAYGTVTIAQQFAFEAEAMLVFSPWSHVGFEVGPTADIPISGSQRVESTSAFGTPVLSPSEPRLEMLQVGLSAAMLCYF
jgi:opacity protein-like surface antigen